MYVPAPPWEKKKLLLKLVKECEEDLSEEEREQLFILLLNYADVFAGRDGSLPASLCRWNVQMSGLWPDDFPPPL